MQQPSKTANTDTAEVAGSDKSEVSKYVASAHCKHTWTAADEILAAKHTIWLHFFYEYWCGLVQAKYPHLYFMRQFEIHTASSKVDCKRACIRAQHNVLSNLKLTITQRFANTSAEQVNKFLTNGDTWQAIQHRRSQQTLSGALRGKSKLVASSDLRGIPVVQLCFAQ